MKDAYYFPHDSNSRHDRKSKSLIRKYGFEGYGRFWVIVEMLRDEPTFKLPADDMTYDAIGSEIGLDLQQAKTFVQELIHLFKLLTTDGQQLWSDSLIRRMDEVDARRNKFVTAGIVSGLARTVKHTATNGIVTDPEAALMGDTELFAALSKRFPLLSENEYKMNLAAFITAQKDISFARPYPDIRTHFFNTLVKQLLPNGTKQLATANVASFREKYGKKGQ